MDSLLPGAFKSASSAAEVRFVASGFQTSSALDVVSGRPLTEVCVFAMAVDVAVAVAMVPAVLGLPFRARSATLLFTRLELGPLNSSDVPILANASRFQL